MFNKAGPHFEGMTNKCKQVWNKMKSMESGTNPRDPKKFSDNLLTLLQVEVASRELHNTAERVDEVRVSLGSQHHQQEQGKERHH